MKTSILTTTIALCLLPVMHLRAQSASPFSVTGSDPSVPEISIQQNTSTNTKRGDLTFAYKYNIPTTTGQAFLEISNPNGEWSWRKNADGSPVEQMWLGDDGTLKVRGNFNGSLSGSITLNPYGQSITLTSASGQTQTVLTSNGTANLAFGTNASTSTGSSNALALGYSAHTYNNNAIAIGNSASASATGSTALGYSNYASGDYSTAMGNNTYAQGYSQFVVGRYNVTGGMSNYWNGTDDLFIVGNGTGSSTRSNAFTVKQNGDTNVNFALYVRDPAYQTDTTAKGAKISYSDKYGGNSNASQTLFNGNRASSDWRFQHPNSYGTTYDAMKLDSFHVLHLYDTMGSTSSVIRLDPGNGSGSPAPSIKLYNQAYTSNATVQISPGTTTSPASLNLYNSNVATTPTIQISPGNTTGTSASILVAGSNVITQATGDQRYLLLGMSASTGLASGTGSAAASNAVALGSNAQATFDSSVAIGSGALAQQQGATAVGSSATAVGMYSAAIGYLNNASGDYATALGYGTIAQGYSQFVVGSYNVPSGGLQASWDSASELFTVGNGTSDSNRSNAFVVKKNANATIGTGLESPTASQLVVGRYNDTTFDRTSGAFIVATGDKTDGVITRKNALRVTDDGAVLVAPGGDISMGEFTAGPQP